MKKVKKFMEKDVKELKKPYEFLSKNERLILGFLQDCPKQYTEIIDHLETLGIKKRTTNNILNKLVNKKKAFRIKKAEDGRIFYRFNDFPDKINALLYLLEMYNTENPFEKLFIDKLIYSIKTLYPKYNQKQIVSAILLEMKLTYQKNEQDIFLEALSKVNFDEFKTSINKLSELNAKLSKLPKIS